MTAVPAAASPRSFTDSRPQPAVVLPPAGQRSFVVSGVGGSGVAQIDDQQRALRGAATTSSSTISTVTVKGAYALRQAFTFAPDGSLTGVMLNEAVPLGDGATVGTLVTNTSSSVEILAGGSIHLVSTGTATPLAEVAGIVVAPRDLTVDVVLAPDLVQVVTERVLVVTSGPAIASAAPVGPVAAPRAVTADAGTPLAPSDPAPTSLSSPDPLVVQDPAVPPGTQDPARLTEPVVDQPPVTR